MNYSVFRFTLNMHNHRSQASVAAFRGDTAIRLLITLTDGGNPYYIEDGCFAVINGTKADETIFRNYCTILNNTVIQYDFTDQTSSCEGVVNCDISLFGADDKLLTAPKFTLVIDEREANNDGLIESVTESSALDEVFKFKASHNSDAAAHQALFQAQQASLKDHNNATGMHYNAFREHNADENAHSALFAKMDGWISNNFDNITDLQSAVKVLERTSITDIKVSFSNETKNLTFNILRDGYNGADKDISVNLPLSALKIASVNDYIKDEKRYLEITFEDGTKLSDIEFDEIFRGIDELLKDKVNTSDLEASLSAMNDAIAEKANSADVETALNGKIDKITNETDYGKVLYFPAQSSTPTAIGLDTRVLEGGVVRRKFAPNAGHIELPDLATNPPTLPNLAVPKEYVDNSAEAINKRVDKIEGMLINYIEDSTEAYSKSVPTKAAPKAILNRIGGKTWNGLPREFPITFNLVNEDENGGVESYFIGEFLAGTYEYTVEHNGTDVRLQYGNETISNLTSGTFKLTEKSSVYITDGLSSPFNTTVTVNIKSLNIFPTKVKEIVSRGRNLVKNIGYYGGSTDGTVISTTEPTNVLEVTQTRYIPREEEDYSGDYRNGYVYYKFEGSLIGGRRYKVSFDIDIKENPLNYDKILLNLQGGQGISHNLPATGKGKVVGVLVNGTNPDRNGFLDIRCMGMSFTLSNVMITNENADISTYSPYIAETYALPEEIQALDGYGWGINSDCYNYVDYEKKQFVKRVGKVDLGTITPTLYNITTGNLFRFIINDIKLSYNSVEVANVLCARYPTIAQSYRTNNTLSMPIKNPAVDIVTNDYVDTTSLKTAMSGVMLYYELAKPVETDISYILTDYTDYKFIEVEGGGELIAKNENETETAIPWTVTFAEV